MKTKDTKDKWSGNFGTILTIQTNQWVSQGSYVTLMTVDRDGVAFAKACSLHLRDNETHAFVYRDPYDHNKVYEQSVSL